ncbi:MAG: hypothetical protein ACXWJW_06835 [Xanthobacteraceae bacterium]
MDSAQQLAALEQQRDQAAAKVQSLQDQIAQLQAEIARLKNAPKTWGNRKALRDAQRELEALLARLAVAQKRLDDLNSQIANFNRPEHRQDHQPALRKVRSRVVVPAPCSGPSNPCDLRTPTTFVPHPIPEPGNPVIKNVTPITSSPGLLESDSGVVRQTPGAMGTPMTPGTLPNFTRGGGVR